MILGKDGYLWKLKAGGCLINQKYMGTNIHYPKFIQKRNLLYLVLNMEELILPTKYVGKRIRIKCKVELVDK